MVEHILIWAIVGIMDILAIYTSLETHDPFYAGVALAGTGAIMLLVWQMYRER